MTAIAHPPTPVTVVGSINIDVTTPVERLPGPGETVVGGDSRRSLGGKGANQAAAIAQLLGGCRMVGAVGDDLDGAWALGELAAVGVDTEPTLAVPGVPTGAAFITVDAEGENTIVVSPGANAEVRAPDDLTGSIVVLSLEIPWETAVRAAAAADGTVVLNASPARRLPAELVSGCDVIIVNETEYDLMPELGSARLVVRTEGARGAVILRDGREQQRIPAHAVAHVVSSVGAGDAFCAGLVAGLASGLEVEDAAALASTVAADVLGQPTAQARLDTIASYLARPGAARRA